MMSTFSFFCVRDEKNPLVLLRGMVNWFPNGYAVKVLKESSAYEGEVTSDLVSRFCEDLNLSLEEYMNECKVAFSSNAGDNVYSLVLDDELLYVKKRCEAETGSTFKVIFSKVSLKAIEYSSTVLDILDVSLKSNAEYGGKIETLSRKNENLLSDNLEMVKRLEEMTKNKLQFEEIIYHKLMNLLNSKKEYYKKQLPSKQKNNDMEFDESQPPLSTNCKAEETIFDADTDCELGDDALSDHANQSCSSVVITTPISKSTEESSQPSILKDVAMLPCSPKKSTAPDSSIVEATSNVQNILNSFSFLDPSVSFLNK